MKIKYKDNEVIYTRLDFDKSTGEFYINDGKQSGIRYEPSLGLIQEYEPSDYDCLIFANDSPNCTENSIYQVYVDSVRIGWIFPIQALMSQEHNYVNNQHFLKYAYVATHYLLSTIDDIDNIQTPSEFSLEDYYDASKSILVLDKVNCSSINNFHIDDYIVSLYKYGYSLNGKGNLDADPLEADRTKIKLKPLSKDLVNTHYINALFQNQFPVQEDDITRFYFIYQVIEFLISVIFEHQIGRIVDKLNENPDKLFEIRDDLNEIGKEKNRIGRLFNCYVRRIETQYITDLNTACVIFLKQNNLEEKTDYWENLYMVRCFLVHKLYTIDTRSIGALKNINRCFMSLIIEVLLSFEKPSE